jgi:hypothetical protein
MYNRRYYENGGDTMQPDSSGQGIMQAAPQDMQQQTGQASPIKDPNHALQIIIQMLIAQGIPPEQAKQIALEMIKAVAEGGMQEMSDERIHARFGGVMHNGREHYGIGSFFKSVGNVIGGAVKGVTNAVKSVVKSDLGKMALTAAAVYFGGPMLAGATEGTAFGSALFGSPVGGLGLEAISTPGLIGTAGQYAPMSGTLFGSNSLLGGLTSSLVGTGGGSSLLSNPLVTGGLGYLAGTMSGKPPEQNPGESNADYQKRVDAWKTTLNTGLTNPTLSSANNPSPLFPNNPFYAQRRAEGGRMGYAGGGIGDIVNQVTKQEFFGKPMMADGGRMHYGLGSFISGSGVATAEANPSGSGNTSGFGGMLGRLISQHPEMFKRQQDVSSLTPEELEALLNQQRAQAAHGGLPLGKPRKNTQGVSELDYRDTGGFVPPIGIKEKADDIPAMLSNNEFVFTADAVRNAGRGNPDLGAKRMYKLMKHLEAGGVV